MAVIFICVGAVLAVLLFVMAVKLTFGMAAFAGQLIASVFFAAYHVIGFVGKLIAGSLTFGLIGFSMARYLSIPVYILGISSIWFNLSVSPIKLDSSKVSEIAITNENGEYAITDSELLMKACEEINGLSGHRKYPFAKVKKYDSNTNSVVVLDENGNTIKSIEIVSKQWLLVGNGKKADCYQVKDISLADDLQQYAASQAHSGLMSRNAELIQACLDSITVDGTIMTFTIPDWQIDEYWDIESGGSYVDPENPQKLVSCNPFEGVGSEWRKGDTVSVDLGNHKYHSLDFIITLDGYASRTVITDKLSAELR